VGGPRLSTRASFAARVRHAARALVQYCTRHASGPQARPRRRSSATPRWPPRPTAAPGQPGGRTRAWLAGAGRPARRPRALVRAAQRVDGLRGVRGPHPVGLTTRLCARAAGSSSSARCTHTRVGVGVLKQLLKPPGCARCERDARWHNGDPGAAAPVTPCSVADIFFFVQHSLKPAPSSASPLTLPPLFLNAQPPVLHTASCGPPARPLPPRPAQNQAESPQPASSPPQHPLFLQRQQASRPPYQHAGVQTTPSAALTMTPRPLWKRVLLAALLAGLCSAQTAPAQQQTQANNLSPSQGARAWRGAAS
jgi:hypothetical protein